MGNVRWERPAGEQYPWVTLCVIVAVAAGLFVMAGARLFLFVVVSLLLGVIVANWYVWRRGWSPVWDFDQGSFWERAEVFIPEFERLLESEKVPFEDIGPPPVKIVPLYPRWDGGYSLGDQLRMYYMAGRRNTLVYIGPVLEGNRREVELMKGLVERAVAPPHHHEGIE